MESGQLIAFLTRLTSDVGLAEELAQDALVAALEQWPASGGPVKHGARLVMTTGRRSAHARCQRPCWGAPATPGAGRMTTAGRRAIDQFRRNENLQRKTAEIGHALA